MLRPTLAAFAGALALPCAVFAAEPLPPPVAPLPPPPQWTGLYAGLNAGGTWSNNYAVATAAANVASAPGFQPLGLASAGLAATNVPVPISGFIGGGQWGGNYQFNNWVLGAEGDFQGIAASNRTDTVFSRATAVVLGTPLPVNQIFTASRRLDWLGTERTRIGFLLWPSFLVYGTGGLAYGETQASVSIGQTVAFPGFSPAASFGTLSHTLAGWTAGGGIEWLFYSNWSLKVEYLFYDLGRVTFAMSPLVHSFAGTPVAVGAPAVSTRFEGNIVRAGLNYHFNLGALPVVAKY